MRNAGNAILVGPMGSGKSAIGRLLATPLGLEFVDVDTCIEEQSGMTIAGIFVAEGEAGFRCRESRALVEALWKPARVIATGGGAILDAGNRDAMRRAGTVVYLRVDTQEQLRRVAGDSARPLLDVADLGQRLAELQAQREPLYLELADVVFDTSEHTPAAAAITLAAILATSMEPSA